MSLVRKLFQTIAFGLFLASIMIMVVTFPSVRDAPTIKGASQQQPPPAPPAPPALEAGGAPDPQADGVKQAAVAAAEKKRRDADRSVCHSELLQDVDFFGHDVGSHRADAAEECCVLCQDTPRCGAFTFVASTCWFKGRVNMAEDKQSNPGCVSGFVRERPESSQYIQTRKERKHRPPPPPLPPPPPYAIYLWLAPITVSLLCCMLSHATNGTPLLVHEGGAKCDADDCCACDA